MSKKTKSIIGYIALIAVLITIVVLIWVYAPAIKGAIDNERYYTPEEVEQIKEEHNQEKADMQEQIDYFKSQVDKYLKDIEDYKTQVADLTKSLNEALSQGNVDKEEIQELNKTITELNNQIHNLNNQVTYYQELLEAYENNGKLIVTFTLVDNGIQTVYDVQVVEPNAYLTEVITPEGDFEGWTTEIGGEFIDDLTTVQVTENITIYGIFSNTVTFVIQDQEPTTQVVSYNGYATHEDVNIVGYTFKGWSLDKTNVVKLNETPITKDTTFYAILEKKDNFEKITWNGLTNFDATYIWTDNEDFYYSNGAQQYILNKETRTWNEKTWNSSSYPYEGNNVWTDGEDIYYSKNGIQLILNKNSNTWVDKTWNGITSFNGEHIWTDGNYVYNSYATYAFVLDKNTDTWNRINWDFKPNGSYVWTDGENIYYSNNKVFNKITQTWSDMTWNGLTNFDCRDIWIYKNTIYYSNGIKQYTLNKDTSTWVEKEDWTGLNDFYGRYIWTDGTNLYYSNNENQYFLYI